MLCVLFFFFKQKTAYEVRISDWSSDVCSSDLEGLDSSLIHLGWGGDIDWSDERFDDFEEIRKEWVEKEDPGASGKDPNIEITYAFRAGLQIGDYVVISDGRDSFRALGGVRSEERRVGKECVSTCRHRWSPSQ